MNSRKQNKICKASPCQKAFTLIELLVVVAIVAMLAGLRLPAFAAVKTKSKSMQCLNNTRQLSLAWLMYAGDNRDYFLSSADDGSGTGPYGTNSSYRGNNYAWAWSKMDFSTVAWNTDPAADIILRPMWNYNQNASIYKCPSDPSAVSVNGTATPRIRSYSMNWFLGGYGENVTMQSESGANFPFYTKLTDLENPVRSPGAANTFLFIEERYDCINWPNFETDMSGYPASGHPAQPNLYEWDEDMPASYHSGSASIAFADGHTEMHKWLEGSTMPKYNPINGPALSGVSPLPVPYSQDVAWMQNVSARPSN